MDRAELEWKGLKIKKVITKSHIGIGITVPN